MHCLIAVSWMQLDALKYAVVYLIKDLLSIAGLQLLLGLLHQAQHTRPCLSHQRVLWPMSSSQTLQANKGPLKHLKVLKQQQQQY
jgi:hypothetical protein